MDSEKERDVKTEEILCEEQIDDICSNSQSDLKLFTGETIQKNSLILKIFPNEFFQDSDMLMDKDILESVLPDNNCMLDKEIPSSDDEDILLSSILSYHETDQPKDIVNVNTIIDKFAQCQKEQLSSSSQLQISERIMSLKNQMYIANNSERYETARAKLLLSLLKK